MLLLIFENFDLEEEHLEYDYVAAEEKSKEMEELVKNIIMNNTTGDFENATCFDIQKMSLEISDGLIKIIFNEYEDSTYPIQIIPPGCEFSRQRVIVIPNGFTDVAKSTKLGNIKLNWKKLCILSCESVFPIAAATRMLWLIPFTALVVCNKFWSLQNITITKRDAIVIWTMWKNRDPEDCIEAKNVLDFVNKELFNFSCPSMTQAELEIIIKNLEKIKCIEKTEENKLQLVEEIKVDY